MFEKYGRSSSSTSHKPSPKKEAVLRCSTKLFSPELMKIRRCMIQYRTGIGKGYLLVASVQKFTK